MLQKISLVQLTLVALLVAFVGFSTPGSATNPTYEQDPPTTVNTTGCQAGQCYLITSPAPPQNCAYSSIYIVFDSTGYGQAMYATAMMAKASSRPVRVVYSQAGGSGGVCTATLVAAE
jgi:hypothetical protein